MNYQAEAQRLLALLLKEHGHAVRAQNGWLVVDNGMPLLAAKIFIFPKRTETTSLLQLDVLASFGNEGVLVESFAGFGEDTKQALENAFANFATNSLPVFMAAFYGSAKDQVTIERWMINGISWRAVLGSVGYILPPDSDLTLPETAFPLLIQLVHSLPLTGTRHWYRFFYARVNGSVTCELVFDNQLWREGVNAMMRLPWPEEPDRYALRCFAVLDRGQSHDKSRTTRLRADIS